jgi:hypothetical protein
MLDQTYLHQSLRIIPRPLAEPATIGKSPQSWKRRSDGDPGEHSFSRSGMDTVHQTEKLTGDLCLPCGLLHLASHT